MSTRIAVLLLAAILVRAQDSTGSVTGVVQDILGNVLRDVAVTLELPDRSHQQSRTDDKGFYRFSALSPGSYNLSTVSPGFVRFTAQLDLGAGEQRSLPPVEPMVSMCGDPPTPSAVRFLEQPGLTGTLKGTLTETSARDSAPVRGVKIAVRCPAGRTCGRTTTTDREGRFAFDNLPPDIYTIDINGAPYRSPFRQGSRYSAGYQVEAGFEMSYSFPMQLTREAEANGVKMRIDGKLVTVFLCE